MMMWFFLMQKDLMQNCRKFSVLILLNSNEIEKTFFSPNFKHQFAKQSEISKTLKSQYFQLPNQHLSVELLESPWKDAFAIPFCGKIPPDRFLLHHNYHLFLLLMQHFCQKTQISQRYSSSVIIFSISK